MGCAASSPADAPLSDISSPALPSPPLPHAHHLLGGLAKALELEYGAPQEVGAVGTWMTLELEARPSSHFVDMGTELQACLDFVAAIETAVKANTTTIDSLREQWGCPAEPRRHAAPTGPVALADVVAIGSSADSWRLRADVADAPKGHSGSATADDGDSMNDDDSEDDRVLPPDDENPDGLVGDGRYR